MMKPTIPLYKPFMPELPEMDHILHSGQLAYGTYTRNFEEKLKEYTKAKKEYEDMSKKLKNTIRKFN